MSGPWVADKLGREVACRFCGGVEMQVGGHLSEMFLHCARCGADGPIGRGFYDAVDRYVREMGLLPRQFPVTVKPLPWREMSLSLTTAHALGLVYCIQVTKDPAGWRTTLSGTVLYEGPDLVAARAAGDRHFFAAVSEVLE